MGLFDRFKSDKAPTQEASAAVRVKKGTAPTQKGLTAKEWWKKGAALSHLGRDQEALQCCDKALAIDPNDAVAWALKGAALGTLGRYQEAIPCYDKALAIDPKNADSWASKGAALCLLNRHREAIPCIDKALAIDPQNVSAHQVKRVISASK